MNAFKKKSVNLRKYAPFFTSRVFAFFQISSMISIFMKTVKNWQMVQCVKFWKENYELFFHRFLLLLWKFRQFRSFPLPNSSIRQCTQNTDEPFSRSEKWRLVSGKSLINIRLGGVSERDGRLLLGILKWSQIVPVPHLFWLGNDWNEIEFVILAHV